MTRRKILAWIGWIIYWVPLSFWWPYSSLYPSPLRSLGRGEQPSKANQPADIKEEQIAYLPEIPQPRTLSCIASKRLLAFSSRHTANRWQQAAHVGHRTMQQRHTSSLASFKPSSVTALTSLMTLILAAASKPSSLTSNSVFSSTGAAGAAAACPPGAAKPAEKRMTQQKLAMIYFPPDCLAKCVPH